MRGIFQENSCFTTTGDHLRFPLVARSHCGTTAPQGRHPKLRHGSGAHDDGSGLAEKSHHMVFLEPKGTGEKKRPSCRVICLGDFSR